MQRFLGPDLLGTLATILLMGALGLGLARYIGGQIIRLYQQRADAFRVRGLIQETQRIEELERRVHRLDEEDRQEERLLARAEREVRVTAGNHEPKEWTSQH